jgi:hypothetical protein
MRLFLLSVLLCTFFGCSDIKINKPDISQQNEYSLIKISPLQEGTTTETLISVSKDIDGSVGGNISLSKSYRSLGSGLVLVNINLDIPVGAFSGVKKITLTADDQYAALKCDPSMVFKKSLSLDFSYLGLNLKNLNLSLRRVDFGYIARDGSFYPVKNNGVQVNALLGLLLVKEAHIDHFSRYGWATRY